MVKSTYADVAQRIEQSRPKGEVVSSILTIGTKLGYFLSGLSATIEKVPLYSIKWRR